MSMITDRFVGHMIGETVGLRCCVFLYFGFVWFDGMSTIEGYLMPYLVITYLLDIYDLWT